MGEIKEPDPVKLFTGITFHHSINPEIVKEHLTREFGEVDLISSVIDFSAFTDYYQSEMGEGLRKFWVGFRELVHPGTLPDVKVKTNQMEWLLTGKAEGRKVNLDPGYLTRANMVLATTKNYSHRIYLARGIYGDVHYIFRDKKFQIQPWTYPDYREPGVIEFFEQLRTLYLKQLKEFLHGNV